MKTVTEHFDAKNKKHIAAFKHLTENGSWPEDFMTEIQQMEFPPFYLQEIALKLAVKYCESVLD